ncbi:serine hydrolase [Isosphaeraceae bacterium EP7]
MSARTLASLLLAFLMATFAPTGAQAAEDLGAAFKGMIDAHGDGVEAGIWVGGVEGEPSLSIRPDAVMPTASTIKTAYLIELFAAYPDALDAPLPGADAILNETGHPALAPYTDDQRAGIRKSLRGASTRRIGETMMGGFEAPNDVYNAAASLVTAALGGPVALTAKIAARDPAFAPIQARRYMLAPRDQPGDNTATTRALAAVIQRLAAGTLKGVSGPTHEAIRRAMETRKVNGRTLISKTGSLDTDPITRCRTGWIESPNGPVVYAIMLQQPGPGARPRPEAAQRLHDLVGAIERLVIGDAGGPRSLR